MRLLVVYKKSFLETHGAAARRLGRRDPAYRDRLALAHRENRRTLDAVLAALRERRIRADVVYRGDAARRDVYDLVLSVGGDGTLFAAAGYVRDTPLLGVNSDPANSLGLWTGTNRAGFPAALDRALAGRLHAVRLTRLRVAVNGRPLEVQAFNDVLFAHRNPAAMTRYRLAVGSRTEDQKSSGLWIATAAGSTAAIRSAGGRRLPLGTRRFQYLVREPYGWPRRGTALVHGFAERLSVIPYVADSAVWIDGARLRRDLELGDRIDFSPGAPVALLGVDERRRRRLFP
jgi:NAD+ kinase